MLGDMQSAKISTINNLWEARSQMSACISRICWEQGEHRKVSEIITAIDALITKLLPNEGTAGKEPKREPVDITCSLFSKLNKSISNSKSILS